MIFCSNGGASYIMSEIIAKDNLNVANLIAKNNLNIVNLMQNFENLTTEQNSLILNSNSPWVMWVCVKAP